MNMHIFNDFVSNLVGFKIVRFNLDSNTCSRNIPVFNRGSLFKELFTILEIDYNVKYRISLIFICSNNNVKCIKEYIEFNSMDLFSQEFDKFFNEFDNFVKEHRKKTESESGLNTHVVDVIIYTNEDNN